MRAVAAAVILAIVLAGCSGRSSRPDSPLQLEFEMLENDLRTGTVTFQRDPGPQTVWDAGANSRPAQVVQVEARRVNGTSLGNLTTWVDAESLLDVAQVSGCPDPVAGTCGIVRVSWPRDRFSFTWFGSALTSRLSLVDADATIQIGNNEHRFLAESRGEDRVRLLPQGTHGRYSSVCNLLDDETVVDVSNHLVLECHGESGEPSYRLVGDPIRLPIEDDAEPRTAQTPFGRLEPRNGPLPPGADLQLREGAFTLAKAYEVALDQSEGFADFVAAHPEAALEQGGSIGGGSSNTADVLSKRSNVVLIRLVASGKAGYEVEVVRNITTVAGLQPQTQYDLRKDGPWEPPAHHSWDEMRPVPDGMVSMKAVAEGVGKFGPGWDVLVLEPINVASSGDPGPVIEYFAAMASPACPSLDAPQCFVEEYVSVDAATGLLVEAHLGSDRLRAVFT